MNILKSDFKKGTVHLYVTDVDDLWYLSHLIEAGDFVKGKTTRKIKIGEGENAKSVKKTYTLKIEAETIEFTEKSLRINGKIKEGPEDIPRDSYQSITLEEGSEFSLEKISWPAYQRQRLEEATAKQYTYLLCLFDREEVLFALTKKFGYEILAKLQGDVPKKTKTVDIKKDFHTELIKSLETYFNRYKPEHIILASPAFYKEDLFQKITNQDMKNKIVLATCSDISERSLDEVLKRPELEATLKSSRARKEQLLVDELLKEINKDGAAAYGWKDIEESGNKGAIRVLLVTDTYIKQQKEDGKFEALDAIMKLIDTMKGEITIISSELESGQKLDGLGGIAALLRYKSYG